MKRMWTPGHAQGAQTCSRGPSCLWILGTWVVWVWTVNSVQPDKTLEQLIGLVCFLFTVSSMLHFAEMLRLSSLCETGMSTPVGRRGPCKSRCLLGPPSTRLCTF